VAPLANFREYGNEPSKVGSFLTAPNYEHSQGRSCTMDIISYTNTIQLLGKILSQL
jgi:hypothetical protein